MKLVFDLIKAHNKNNFILISRIISLNNITCEFLSFFFFHVLQPLTKCYI